MTYSFIGHNVNVDNGHLLVPNANHLGGRPITMHIDSKNWSLPFTPPLTLALCFSRILVRFLPTHNPPILGILTYPPPSWIFWEYHMFFPILQIKNSKVLWGNISNSWPLTLVTFKTFNIWKFDPWCLSPKILNVFNFGGQFWFPWTSSPQTLTHVFQILGLLAIQHLALVTKAS